MRVQAGEWHSYDAVLLAGPLELANIEIGGFEYKKPPLRKFQQTVTTLVQGRLRPAYFGVRKLPKGMLPCPSSKPARATSALALGSKVMENQENT